MDPMILVAGNVNLETQLRVEDGFPIEYSKSRFAFFGVSDHISGVAYNIASGLAVLGHRTGLLTMLGTDSLGALIKDELERTSIDVRGVRRVVPATPRSVILNDKDGRGAIFTDLKNLQDCEYPLDVARPLIEEAALVHATNINWALPVAHAAREMGKIVSTDVQAIRSLDDEYNRRFIDVADIVFFSAENLEVPIEEVIHEMWEKFDVKLAVCGRGADGGTVGVRETGEIFSLPATATGPVQSTTGCGDAMAACFVSSHVCEFSPRNALLRAQIFAGHKLGFVGGATGFLTRPELDERFETVVVG